MKLILNKTTSTVLIVSVLLIGISINKATIGDNINDNQFVSFVADPQKGNIRFFWKNEKGHNYGNFQRIKNKMETVAKSLIFSTNGGMYDKDHKPNGLYIENGIVLTPINRTKNGYGNFYLQPNGVFSITNNGKADIRATNELKSYKNIKYATQSGPMLLINGKIHQKFNKGSKHKNIRNGVGLLPNGNILFVMSKAKINFYDFASFFKLKGCEDALYLDGFISKTYLPSKKWVQTDGNFGVIISVTSSNSNMSN